MAKLNRDQALQEGEQLLREWGIEAGAGAAELQPLVGRSGSADAAIAERLGREPSEESVQLLQLLERQGDKLTRKEAKRALYRLEQRGLTVPKQAPAPPAPVLTTSVEGYLSPVDGNGDQLVWIVKPRAGGVLQLFAVINDPGGLREVEVNAITRKSLREIRNELQAKHELVLVESDWRYCDHLIHRAFGWARRHESPMSGDYRAARAQITRESEPEDMPPLIFRYVDPADVRSEGAHLARSAELLNEKELRTWFLPPDRLRPYLDELTGMKESPLILSPHQEKDRFASCLERALVELFSAESRDSYMRRLHELAYFFYATGRPEQAKQAVAAALAIGESPRGGRDIPFFQTLVETSLRAWVELAAREEEEKARSSLVLTPRQAAERQRR